MSLKALNGLGRVSIFSVDIVERVPGPFMDTSTCSPFWAALSVFAVLMESKYAKCRKSGAD